MQQRIGVFLGFFALAFTCYGQYYKSTTTSLASSRNPSQAGQAVTLTARVSSSRGTPSGTVQLLDGSTLLRAASLSRGTATFTISGLSVGSHALTAHYVGQSAYRASTSKIVAQVVQGATTSTSTALTSSPNPSAAGQTVALTARVSAANGSAPSGSVQFFDGSASLGSAALSVGTASLSVSNLSAGSHSLTASYAGNSIYAGSTSAVLTQVVASAATSTSLISSANPASAGQSIAFTATVTGANGTPTGSVQFRDGSTALGAATLSSGLASLAVASLGVGTHPITASYLGSSYYAPSVSATLSQVVNKVATTTTLTSSANPAQAGVAVTLTASVAAVSGTPTGSVQLLDGGSTFATVTLSGGRGVLVINSLSAGTHSLTASYNGAASYASSASAVLIETISANPATTTGLTSSSNPSVVGQAVTFTAFVSAAGGTPTGSVQLLDGSNALATVTLSGGSASFTSATLSVGTHSITARYGGDSAYSASASQAILQQVDPHSVTLDWGASVSSNAIGYNIYRSGTSGGPYARLNSSPIGSTGYTDNSVLGGHMYFYVCTAVDNGNNESVYSNEAQAAVP
jgi:hypothetical protein